VNSRIVSTPNFVTRNIWLVNVTTRLHEFKLTRLDQTLQGLIMLMDMGEEPEGSVGISRYADGMTEGPAVLWQLDWAS